MWLSTLVPTINAPAREDCSECNDSNAECTGAAYAHARYRPYSRFNSSKQAIRSRTRFVVGRTDSVTLLVFLAFTFASTQIHAGRAYVVSCGFGHTNLDMLGSIIVMDRSVRSPTFDARWEAARGPEGKGRRSHELAWLIYVE